MSSYWINVQFADGRVGKRLVTGKETKVLGVRVFTHQQGPYWVVTDYRTGYRITHSRYSRAATLLTAHDVLERALANGEYTRQASKLPTLNPGVMR